MYTRCDQKGTVIFIFCELRTYIRFSDFFSVLLVHMSVIYVDILDCQFVFDR